MANDWDVVDNPDKYYIPDTETDAGDYIHIDLEHKKEQLKDMQNIMNDQEFPNW